MGTLLEAALSWRPTHFQLEGEESAYRVLRFSNGEVQMARWASQDVVEDLLTDPAGRAPEPPEDRWDIATFDRLSVLVSELRRLLRTHSEVDSIRLHTSGGLQYDADALRSLLRWI